MEKGQVGPLEQARGALRQRIRELEGTFALALHVGLTLVGVYVAVAWLSVALVAVLVAGLVVLVAAFVMFALWVRLELLAMRDPREGGPDGR